LLAVGLSIGGVITVVVAIVAIVQAWRLHRWGWVVGLILVTSASYFAFAPIVVLIYGLNGPKTKRESRPKK
jgi:succinate-acetate transporter protein